MQFSLNWLKRYVDISSSPQELAELLTMRAFEVEGRQDQARPDENIIVAKVIGLKPHPDADKLQLVEINYGRGTAQVVCGATNLKPDQMVPWAQPGSKIADGTEVSKAKIRGVESPGMLLSQKELGIGEEHTGIYILNEPAKPGLPVAKALGVDTVLNIDILPNRASDALSHLGLAREIAVLTKKELSEPEISLQEDRSVKAKKKLSVKIKGNSGCTFYSARLLEDIDVKSSPAWMQQLLILAGMRPINVVVDVTNFVMLEMGQPLHAFDADKISKGSIIVRRAKAGEKITTLDNTRQKLTEDNLLITDPEKPIAVAGVMGDLETEVKESTNSIVLESAVFDPVVIRKSAQVLGARTEASMRFESGIEPERAQVALERAAALLQELSGAKIARGVVYEGTTRTERKSVDLDLDRASRILGYQLNGDSSRDTLIRLGCIARKRKGSLIVMPPVWRPDLKEKADFVEELGRINGYQAIPTTIPKEVLTYPKQSLRRLWAGRIKDRLTSAGFTEVINYSLVGKDLLYTLRNSTAGHLEVANPISEDQKYLRTTLAPRLLQNIARNARHEEQFGVYELGKVYFPTKGRELPKEPWALAAAIVRTEDKAEGFIELKGVLESIFSHLGMNSISYSSLDQTGVSLTWARVFHPGRVAVIKHEEGILGVIGEVHPDVTAEFGIRPRVTLTHLDFELLVKLATWQRTYEPLAKFPTAERDISLFVDRSVTIDEVLSSIQETGGSLIRDVDLFDMYDGDKKTARKSLAFHVIFQSQQKTLKDSEVEELMKNIRDELEKNLKAEIKGI